MEQRYYISDIVGDGSEMNPYRVAISGIPGVATTAIIPSSPDGKPLYTWALVSVRANDHAAIRSHPSAYALPVFPLDGKASGIGQGLGNALQNFMAAKGVAIDLTGITPYRDVIRKIGQHLDASFSEDRFI